MMNKFCEVGADATHCIAARESAVLDPPLPISPAELLHRDLCEWQGTWAFVTSRSDYTLTVRDRLHRAGVPAYVPVELVRVRHGDRMRRVQRVVWPCYTFVCLPDDMGYPELRHLPGMFDVQARSMIHDSHPVPDAEQAQFVDELANLKRCLDADPGYIDKCLGVVPGARVIVTSGPYMGIEGVIDEKTSPGKLILNCHLMGRHAELQIDPGRLEVI